MSALPDTPFSVLDLASIRRGATAAEAFAHTLEAAQRVEALGYRRFWLAEHHNLEGIASAATAVLIAHVAANTQRIRVGAGGVMLPNHATLTVAEQFGTLESLHPGRIDLGLGRAPGTDPATARALRRGLGPETDFAELLDELRGWFAPPEPGQAVRAIPGEGLAVPVWLLGSGGYSARLAGRLGLPFAFASHFAPEHLHDALALYRDSFRPSADLARPYAMVAVNAVVADTQAEAERLATSMKVRFLRLLQQRREPLDPPVDDLAALCTPHELAMIESRLRASAVGDPAQVRRTLQALLEATGADEFIVHCDVWDTAARLRSFELLAELFSRGDRLGATH